MVVVIQRCDECHSIQQGAYCRDGDGRTGQVPGPLSAPRLGLPENSAGEQDRAERHSERDSAPSISERRSPGPVGWGNTDAATSPQLPKPVALISAMLNAVMLVASGVSREDGDHRAEVGGSSSWLRSRSSSWLVIQAPS